MGSESIPIDHHFPLHFIKKNIINHFIKIKNSDIDFLVEFEEGRSLFDLIRLKQELEALLGKSVDVVTEKICASIIERTD